MPTDEAALASTAQVTAPDGAVIGYASSGAGPPLVVVHGGTADHTRWRPILPLLEPHARVHAMDRRGRGASGDGPAYQVAREFEDVAAVVDAVASAAGTPVDLLGHSFGAVCALGGAARTAHVRRVVLYEPPVRSGGDAMSAELLDRLEALLAAGRREELLETFFREAVMMPEAELAVFKTLPAWQARIAAAHTLPREVRAVADGSAFEAGRVSRVTVPTLLLLGGDSPPVVKEETEMVASLLPDARIEVLDGQQHVAMDTAPELFAERVLAFLRP